MKRPRKYRKQWHWKRTKFYFAKPRDISWENYYLIFRTGHNTRVNNSKRLGNKKSVVIVGDSMIKLLNGCKMAKRMQSNFKIYLKTFSKATLSCMEDCMRPSLRNPPDHFILYVGTNGLSSEKSSMEIAKSIINLACRLKKQIYGVNVSTIILRTDDKKLNEKGMEVNLHLKELSKEENNFWLATQGRWECNILTKVNYI